MAQCLRLSIQALTRPSCQWTIIRQMRASVVTLKTIRGYTGGRRTVRTYLVDIEIGALTLPGIEVVGDDATHEILLGRDVLNKLRLLLDGPRQHTEVLS